MLTLQSSQYQDGGLLRGGAPGARAPPWNLNLNIQ